MNQTDNGPEGNEEVCSTTEVQYAEKNVHPMRMGDNTTGIKMIYGSTHNIAAV